MARKTGQIIRRGQQMWMVRIYSATIRKPGNASTSANRSVARCAPHFAVNVAMRWVIVSGPTLRVTDAWLLRTRQKDRASPGNGGTG
jgi:hypothetical protein